MSYKIVVVNIGSELLSGRTLNSNLVFIGNKLSVIGLEISEVHIIPDEKVSILNILQNVWVDSVILIITGGLGPTPDDITRGSISEFFDKKLIYHDEIYIEIEKRFKLRGMDVPETNKVQAFVPEGFIVLENSLGTAPGMYYHESGSERHLFCLPGVPFEMEHLFNLHVLKFISDMGLVNDYFCKDINTYGISESLLAEKMQGLIYKNGVNIAWLPKIGRVDIRISGIDIVACEKVFTQICEDLKEYIWGVNESSPVDMLHRVIRSLAVASYSPTGTISVAESCSGGMLASLITKNSGASAYFKGGVVAYSNESKVELLGVPVEVIEKHGAVSEEAALAMVKGCYERFKSDICVSVTGIAGPDGGSDLKPVGTVYFGLKLFDEIFVEQCYFTGTREVIRVKCCDWMVLKVLGLIWT